MVVQLFLFTLTELSTFCAQLVDNFSREKFGNQFLDKVKNSIKFFHVKNSNLQYTNYVINYFSREKCCWIKTGNDEIKKIKMNFSREKQKK